MPNRRDEIVRDSKPGTTQLQITSVARATPSFYQSQYPQLISFLEAYLEFVRDTDGWGDLLERLTEIRNIDVTESEFAEILRKEYGNAFPDLGTLDDNVAIRLFEYWYRSKGTRDAVEAYFRLFLNSNAEIIFPRDNMFIVDGGDYNTEESRYLNVDSHIDESTMVLQDDDFYQIFSYLVRSDISIVDWGSAFEKIAHPAGWNFFGEVEISAFARFANLTLSPTIVPGFQIEDSDILILAFAAHSMGASSQVIRKALDTILGRLDTFSHREVNVNLLKSTYTIGSWYDTPISDFDPINAQTRLTDRQRPARILVSTV